MRYEVVKVWSTRDWQIQQSWEQSADDAWSIAFSADSQQLFAAVGEWNRSTMVILRDIAKGKVAGHLKHPGKVLCLSVLADGRTVAAGGIDNNVSVLRQAP